MPSSGESNRQRVVVVTGGARGIGAGIALELGRTGCYVITLDPMLTLDGTSPLGESGPTTAERIVEAGGSARASNASVTDRAALESLFAEIAAEFGALDAVINVAGITRSTRFAAGLEGDWAAVVHVHLDGYLNILAAALPLMAEAGHGRILGVTSGSGWRQADAGAYSCAKRAVANLTWQIGQVAPPGVTVNAFSPIALTRMVTGGTTPRETGAAEAARTGGVDFSAMPLPENLGPVGAYLASEQFSWCGGQVIFSGGAEVAWLRPPALLEVCRTTGVRSLPHVIATATSVALVPAEAAQATNGGSNPRFAAAFDEAVAGADAVGPDRLRSCLVVTDDPAWGAAVGHALESTGVTCLGLGAWSGSHQVAGEVPTDFEGAAAQIALAAKETGTLDGVVVALSGAAPVSTSGAEPWRAILDEHAGIDKDIVTDAAWARAVSDYSEQADRPVRLATVVSAVSSGGRSRAQAAAQLARSAHTGTSDRVDNFVISVEGAGEAERRTAAELAAHLLRAPDTSGLSGAELVVAPGWFGLRSHPVPATSISFGGPAMPEWLDAMLRGVVAGTTHL
jgi:NAD(P)-dependent dehydrogenase (short-subunit alcohol dehydrogenase family)